MIFQTDSDGQFVVAEFPHPLGRSGTRATSSSASVRNGHDPTHRLLLTRAVRLAASLLAGSRIRDVNTPFRLLRRSLWTELEPHIEPGDARAQHPRDAGRRRSRPARIVERPGHPSGT